MSDASSCKRLCCLLSGTSPFLQTCKSELHYITNKPHVCMYYALLWCRRAERKPFKNENPLVSPDSCAFKMPLFRMVVMVVVMMMVLVVVMVLMSLGWRRECLHIPIRYRPVEPGSVLYPGAKPLAVNVRCCSLRVGGMLRRGGSKFATTSAKLSRSSVSVLSLRHHSTF